MVRQTAGYQWWEKSSENPKTDLERSCRQPSATILRFLADLVWNLSELMCVVVCRRRLDRYFRVL